jgi:hypothetical protein
VRFLTKLLLIITITGRLSYEIMKIFNFMKDIGDYIDQNPTGCSCVIILLFFTWIAFEFLTAESYDGDDF